MTTEELSHRRGRRPKNGVVMKSEHSHGKHSLRRIERLKDDKLGTITFLTNDFDTDANTICEIYMQRWQIETLFRRLKQNFSLKYFLGENRNAITIQIWVYMIAWLLMAIVRSQEKRKWSLSDDFYTIHLFILHKLVYLPQHARIKVDKPYRRYACNGKGGAGGYAFWRSKLPCQGNGGLEKPHNRTIETLLRL